MQPNIITGAGISIDVDLRIVSTGSGPVRLTRTQFGILHALVSRRAVVRYDTLVSIIYPNPDREPDYAENVIKVSVCNMRRLLRDAGAPDVIGLSWGVGYFFQGHRATS